MSAGAEQFMPMHFFLESRINLSNPYTPRTIEEQARRGTAATPRKWNGLPRSDKAEPVGLKSVNVCVAEQRSPGGSWQIDPKTNRWRKIIDSTEEPKADCATAVPPEVHPLAQCRASSSAGTVVAKILEFDAVGGGIDEEELKAIPRVQREDEKQAAHAGVLPKELDEIAIRRFWQGGDLLNRGRQLNQGCFKRSECIPRVAKPMRPLIRYCKPTPHEVAARGTYVKYQLMWSLSGAPSSPFPPSMFTL